MKTLAAALAATLPLLLPAAPALAANDGLDARTHAKVMRAKRAQAIDSKGREPARGYQESCGNGANIGNVYTDRNSRNAAPRENTVVVTGDVIVLPGRNCR